LMAGAPPLRLTIFTAWQNVFILLSKNESGLIKSPTCLCVPH
jgi:hypothetical protein